MDTNLPGERGWILHRNREQPTPSPSEPPLSQIKFYLDRYRIKEALQIFFEENTLRLLGVESDFMWDIIPIICKRLRGLCQYRFRVFEGCERMLCRIAVDVNCNPKEVLISLLAELSHQEEYDDDNVYRAMIRPLEGTLLRMNQPSPRDENFRWVLNVLMRHVRDIELPQDYNLDGKKRLTFSNDPIVKRFIEVLPLMLSFIEEFNDRPIDFDKAPMPILTESQINEVLNGELDDDLMNDHGPNRGVSLDASVTALLSLMNRPLAFLDLTVFCPDLRVFANRCLNTLLRLRPNLFSPLYKRILDKSNFSDSDSFVSDRNFQNNESIILLATCSYVYNCEKVATGLSETVQYFPQVITHESMLFCHIPYIVGFLERTEILVHEKGLILLEVFLKRLSLDSLDQRYLDLFESSSLHQQLFRIMVYSPLCTNRRRAYDMFTLLCDLLTHDCKLKMFRYVLTQTDLRPSVRAACIDQYRKQLTNIYRRMINIQLGVNALKFKTLSGSINCSADDQPGINCPVQLDNNDSNEEIREHVNLIQCLEQCNGENINANLIDAIGIREMRQLQTLYRAIGGSSLVEFLELCIKACLPESQHTDIIENCELVLATLTMFRFLKLRKTSFKDEAEEEYLSGQRLKKSFFDPIRSAIALVTSELKSHHQDLVDGHKRNAKVTSKSILSASQPRNDVDLLFKILGPKLNEMIDPKDTPEFNEQEETECLNWALCRLDLVESVLMRTCDLYNC